MYRWFREIICRVIICCLPMFRLRFSYGLSPFLYISFVLLYSEFASVTKACRKLSNSNQIASNACAVRCRPQAQLARTRVHAYRRRLLSRPQRLVYVFGIRELRIRRVRALVCVSVCVACVYVRTPVSGVSVSLDTQPGRREMGFRPPDNELTLICQSLVGSGRVKKSTAGKKSAPIS